ncbi:hypothetical protein E2C01_095066 [Portunus trituberculatus]|uniref:Uncharacterized protein n=1 Tax=Portunus trituberculatus TaxID=210409 RepID=A0A5B7K3B7_PORTR|nr:hypothetical protein [Portunus trituberculatus]
MRDEAQLAIQQMEHKLSKLKSEAKDAENHVKCFCDVISCGDKYGSPNKHFKRGITLAYDTWNMGHGSWCENRNIITQAGSVLAMQGKRSSNQDQA